MSDNQLSNEELISAYIDGELDTEGCAQVKALLEENSAYRRLFDELREVGDQVRLIPNQQLEQGFRDQVLRETGKSTAAVVMVPHQASVRRIGYVLAGTLAVSTIIALIWGFTRSSPEFNSPAERGAIALDGESDDFSAETISDFADRGELSWIAQVAAALGTSSQDRLREGLREFSNSPRLLVTVQLSHHSSLDILEQTLSQFGVGPSAIINVEPQTGTCYFVSGNLADEIMPNHARLVFANATQAEIESTFHQLRSESGRLVTLQIREIPNDRTVERRQSLATKSDTHTDQRRKVKRLKIHPVGPRQMDVLFIVTTSSENQDSDK